MCGIFIIWMIACNLPVDSSVVTELNVRPNPNDSEAGKAYKILCAKELDWVQKHQDAIVRKANKLYHLIMSGKANYGLKKRCLDFEKLESILAKRQSNT